MKISSNILTTIIFTFIAIALFGQNQNPKIEIYLINKLQNQDSNINISGYSTSTAVDLSDKAFMFDEEIEGYEIIGDTNTLSSKECRYYIYISKSGQEKICKLKNIPLCCGLPFVLTVDRIPIFKGNFWNPVSSFGSAGISITAISTNKIEIQGGIYRNEKDPRGDKLLLKAFKITERLIIK
jgi:hypothetical protein